MVATPDEIKQMDEFFKSRTLDKVFKINKGITFQDLPKYVLNVLTALKSNHMADAAARPRWEDLLQIRKMLEQADKAG